MTNPETTAIIEALLAEHDVADVPGFARQKHGLIVSYADVREVFVAIAKEKLGRSRVETVARAVREMPADFPEHAAVENSLELSERYRASSGVITRWRRESGVKPPEHRHQPRRQATPVPAGFALAAPGLTIRELCDRFGAGRARVRRWLYEANVSCRAPKPGRPSGYVLSPVDRPHVDTSRAGLAAEFLRRFGPVVRCDRHGRYSPKGDRWRRGSTLLSAAEVIERADRNGWRPDEWREVRV